MSDYLLNSNGTTVLGCLVQLFLGLKVDEVGSQLELLCLVVVVQIE